MAIPELARIERIEPRTVWNNEASDFTPWLAQEDNLALLSATIGMDLEFKSSEEFVGPFRADIVCTEANDRLVLIENQLERTDHTHLGQILTYAAGLDAVSVVWIAKYFTDEHRAAVDWLNRVTLEGINFFGVEVEVWRIANSPPGANFKLVCQPNNWSKAISESARRLESGNLSDTQQSHLEYWSQLRNYLREHNSLVRLHEFNDSRQYTSAAIGKSKCDLIASANTQKKFIAVGLEINPPVAQPYYSILYRQREAIEKEIGAPLEWGAPDRGRSRIALRNLSIDPTVQEQWSQQFEWFRKQLEAFDTAFRRRIKDLPAASSASAAYSEPTGADDEDVDATVVPQTGMA